MPRLSQLAAMVNGKIHGDQDPNISEAKTIARASVSDLTFVTDTDHFESFLSSECLAAMVSSKVLAKDAGDRLLESSKSIVEVENAESAFESIVRHFRPEVVRQRIGISPSAHVSPTAIIADDVDIYPGAFVGEGVQIGQGSTVFPGVCILENCRIGSGVKIFPNAVLYENTNVGDNSIIHAGAVLGAYGFGYKSGASGHKLSAQLGNVEIGVEVELGANTTIDRGTYDSSTVGNGTKVDNLVMVGHNCEIGNHNLLCSQVGIAGSCTTGDFVVMAGQVGIGDHLKIGEKSILMAKSGVMHNIPPEQTFLGIPATPVREQMQILAVKAKLPEMRKTLKRLGKTVEQLKAPSDEGINKKDAA